MVIRAKSIIKALLVWLMMMALSYFKLFGDKIELFSTSYISKPLGMLYLGLICMTLAFTFCYYSGRLSRCLIAEVLCVLVGAIAGMMKVRDLGEAVCDALPYLYILLAIPLYTLLQRRLWDFRRLIRLILILTLGSYGIRAYIAIMYALTGSTVLPNIALESAMVNWIRNDMLRVNPPCFSLLFAPFAFYYYITSNKFRDKVLGMGCMAVAVLYHVYVSQARSVLIYNVLILAMMFLFQKKTDKKKFIRILLLMVAVCILVNTSYFNDLINSFSVSNSDTGESTLARFNAIYYFGSKYMGNVLTGIGFTYESTPIGGNISDIGFLYSIFRLGIPLIIFYLIVFIRGITVYCRARLVDADKAILVFGMTVLIMMTGINIDCFFNIFAFAVPFYIAIVEYVAYEISARATENDFMLNRSGVTEI